MPKIYFVGVDVGTSSARAALITSDGKVIKQAARNIRIWNPEHEHFEQSSDDIWNAVCYCVKVGVRQVYDDVVVGMLTDFSGEPKRLRITLI